MENSSMKLRAASWISVSVLVATANGQPAAEARSKMLVDGLDANAAAFEVGYESASQFSREYSRFFGQPPVRDVRMIRESAAH